MTKRILIIIFLFMAGFIGAWLFLNEQETKPSPVATVSPTPIPKDWNGIVPGKTTVEELTAKLGPPLSSNNGLLFYPTTNDYQEHVVYVYGDKVAFIREKISDDSRRSFAALTADLNTPPLVLYGPQHITNTLLYTYLSHGTAFLANKENDYVNEVWFFPPSTETEFLRYPPLEVFGRTPPREPDR